MKTIISPEIEKASHVLQRGGVIIFPTETVYGIGADSRNISACQKIYTIKNRPIDNPFIVHVDSIESMEQIAVIPKKYFDPISKLTPGPITFILEKKDESIFSSGLSTLGVRIPSHPLANALLKSTKIPVAAPSANLSGRPSITRSTDAIDVFSGKVDLILTGEDSEIGIESTVVDLTSNSPILLRPGRISYLELKKIFPNIEKYNLNLNESNIKPASPGIKYRHYAPDCEIVIFNKNDFVIGEDNAYIGFRKIEGFRFYKMIYSNLEYMHSLYSFFIDCDSLKINKAYCEFPIQDEFEEVLLNRIEKAAMK